MSKSVFLIEDHDEALKIWRQKSFKNLDLVHLDAHLDFGFYPAKPIERVMQEAKSLDELKRGLEYSLSFQRYESDFEKQINIGNYIYPAMREGIVKDFYWVIPGGLKEFNESLEFIEKIIASFPRKRESRRQRRRAQNGAYLLKEGIISAEIFGRKFIVCVLEKLPILRQKALLDIDTDFLVIASLLQANNTAKIGQRKPWILPGDLAEALDKRILQKAAITIAYSVNGGWTPMRYKILGDELAYCLSPGQVKERYGQNFTAALFFERFETAGKKEDYQRAVKLNPSYRAADNNYGPLYLSRRKFSQAKREFLRITRIDPKNPHPLIGLGSIALEKREFYQAKRYFSRAWRQKENSAEALFGLGQADFHLKNFRAAKRWFLRDQSRRPLHPQSRYFLGRIYAQEADFEKAVCCYQDALRLGLSNLDVISRLLKISCHAKAKNDIIRYVFRRFQEFKKGYLRAGKISLKPGKKAQGRIENKLRIIEKKLGKMNINEESA